MIRAVFFDFYSVWTPDKLTYYLATAQQNGPEAYKQLYDMVESYYHGQADINALAEAFRVKLGHPDISVNQFMLNETDISPDIVNLMRKLHEHFLKLGILANLGKQEYKILQSFNEHNQIFEVIASPLSFNLPAPLLSKEVFAQALQAIGEPPKSCMLVSGNPYFLQFAASLDMSTLQFEGLPALANSLGSLLSQDLPDTSAIS